MRHGDTGHQVKALQQALNAHGAQLVTDGHYGPQTHAAAALHYQGLGIALVGDTLPDDLWRCTVTSLGLALLAATFDQ